MIVSFSDRATEDLYHNRPTRPRAAVSSGLRERSPGQAGYAEAAGGLLDLAAPPGNRLEALRGDLAGFYSIRVNEQWRIVFRWDGGDAYEVRLTDYHK